MWHRVGHWTESGIRTTATEAVDPGPYPLGVGNYVVLGIHPGPHGAKHAPQLTPGLLLLRPCPHEHVTRGLRRLLGRRPSLSTDGQPASW